MPNYITNKLKISGEESLVARIKEEIASIDDDGRIHSIDFHKVCPLPKELKGTVSPMKTLTQEEYDAQEARIASGDLNEHERRFGVSRGLTYDLQQEYKKRFRACDWYEWQTVNWGTKWNAMESEEEGEQIHFLTAWCTPINLIVHLSDKYPDAEFNVRYADEDFGHNVGEYSLKNGEFVYENIPTGGTSEAYLMAGEISDPTYIACRIEEMEEEDSREKWGMNYIRAAYEGKIFGDYQQFVWDMLKEFAVEDENYEMAQKIKDYVEANKV